MQYKTANKFWDSYQELPKEIQALAVEKFALFIQNPHHNSLRTRKMEGKKEEIWEGHINLDYVFVFRYIEIDGEKAIESLDIGKHDVVYARA